MRCTVEDFPVQKLISFTLSHEYSLYLNNVNIYNKCKISTHQNLNIQDPPVTNEMFAQFEIIFTICDKSSINKSITMHICIHVCFHRENKKLKFCIHATCPHFSLLHDFPPSSIFRIKA